MTTTVTRKIIRIDEERCNGCGECVTACHEGALQIVDGKARLVRDDYCDGLGACIGECPQDALTFEVREAAAFDEAAVEEHLKSAPAHEPAAPAACPSVQAMLTALGQKSACGCPSAAAKAVTPACSEQPGGAPTPSALGNWPTQLTLVPVNAPYLNGADLLLSADCVPFAFGGFHSELLPGRIVLQACPKLDDGDFYLQKLAGMFTVNDIKSITLARMEVPCCGGLTAIVRDALEAAGKDIPLEIVTIGINGEVLSRTS